MQFHFAVNNIVYASVCFVLGVLHLVLPDAMWKLDHFFSARGVEPEPKHRTASRVCGVLLLAAAVVMLLLDFQR